MNILLLNTNPVVSRLIKLCANQIGISIVCMDTIKIDDIKEDTIVIVDDGSFSDDITNILESTHKGYRILLISKWFKQDGLMMFDEIVSKPFVPSRIIDIITYATEEISSLDSITPHNEVTISTTKDSSKTQILDPNELDKIKSILDQDEQSSSTMEVVCIEERKLQAFKEHLLSDGVEVTNQDAYIDDITTSKPQKYKKLLKTLVDNAIDSITTKIGKDKFKQAIKEDRVNLEFHIKEIE